MKNIQKYLISSFISILFVFSLFGTINSIPEYKNKDAMQDNIQTTSVIDSNLESGVESLTVSANVSKRTFSYDIEFESRDYDGLKVKSIFYYRDDVYTLTWFMDDFANSEETIKRGHASNTTSYEQIYDFEDHNQVYAWDNGVRMSVMFQEEKNGDFVAANTHPFNLKIYDGMSAIPFEVDDSQTLMNASEESAYGQVSFFYTTDRSTLSRINLKSNQDDDLNQEIYNNSESSILIENNVNTIGFNLQNNQWYRDLYLEFIFVDSGGAEYIWDSPIDNFDPIHPSSFNTTAIILFIIFIILIIVALIFIFFIFKQMKKRKELERQQDQSYYDENYEDGMN